MFGLQTSPTTTQPVEMQDGDMDPAVMPDATTSIPGKLTAADKAKLDGVEDGAEVNDAVNLASSGATQPAEPEQGIAAGTKTGTAIDLRSVCAQLGLESEVVDGSIRVRRRPRLWQPRARASAETYQRIRCKGRKTAGAFGDNAATGPNFEPALLIASHGAGHSLYPRMIYTGVDSHGAVHHFHKGLRGSYSPTSTVEGYEFGHVVRAGDAKSGQKFVWTLDGQFENVGWADAFVDFSVEINPTIGDFAGPYLMQMLSPELDVTWSGERHWKARVTLEVDGPDSCTVNLEGAIYSASGAVLVPLERSVALATPFDWLTTDARLQLSWRVDKDIATNANVFSGENQGERQGSDVLRCHVDTYEFDPVGLREAA
jgi:hypothetical protein